MLVLLTLLTVGYFVALVWVLRGKRRTRLEGLAGRPAGRPAPEGAEPSVLPVDDRPPATAKGWPPAGRQFAAYVDEGFAALDAYLGQGFAA